MTNEATEGMQVVWLRATYQSGLAAIGRFDSSTTTRSPWIGIGVDPVPLCSPTVSNCLNVSFVDSWVLSNSKFATILYTVWWLQKWELVRGLLWESRTCSNKVLVGRHYSSRASKTIPREILVWSCVTILDHALTILTWNCDHHTLVGICDGTTWSKLVETHYSLSHFSQH